jgi:diguanylate cyclase (GGDEF)-like protein/PAS domain S-box-containing protein
MTLREHLRPSEANDAELLVKAFHESPAAISIVDFDDWKYLDVNDAFLLLVGLERDDIIGRTSERVSLWAEEGERVRFAKMLALQESITGFEAAFRRGSGEIVYGALSAKLIDVKGRTMVLTLAHDITERRRSEEASRYLAFHDPLTDLPNRTLFEDRLQMALSSARRRREKVAVMFMDIDNFKEVNDTLTHAAGDALLKTVAADVKGALRDADTVARIGGDEFAILLPSVNSPEHLIEVAERILETVRKPRMMLGTEVRPAASIGIACYPMDGLDAEKLIHNADKAMYKAKQQGRDQWAVYTAQLGVDARERISLENELRLAISRAEFEMFYQPVVAVDDRHLVSLEALIRWRHPQRGDVNPAMFIRVAEECGAIVDIGEWVIDSVCDQVRDWLDAGLNPVPVAVNVAGVQFVRGDLVATVDRALLRSRLHPRYLRIETTENAVLRDIERAMLVLGALRDRGVEILLDDFGTGYSSLTNLQRLPISAVKIDRAFATGAGSERNRASTASAIIAMAHSIGLRVIAEGIETEEQLAFLRTHRCDEMQGYLQAAPMPAQDYIALLQAPRVTL